MRLTDHQAKAITQLAHEIAGERARVRIFGSLLDDRARGGDLDLMLELPESVANPAASGGAVFNERDPPDEWP